MKKLFNTRSVLASLIALTCLAGCGKQPTAEPSVEPTQQPSVQPTVEPTSEPTLEPTVQPSDEYPGLTDLSVRDAYGENGVVAAAEEAFGVSISVDQKVKTDISNMCLDSKVRTLGARGIIKATGKIFSGSLSAFLSSNMDNTTLRGSKLLCRRVNNDNAVASEGDIEWIMQV